MSVMDEVIAIVARNAMRLVESIGQRLNPAYRLFLDRYTNHAEESVVYAL